MFDIIITIKMIMIIITIIPLLLMNVVHLFQIFLINGLLCLRPTTPTHLNTALNGSLNTLCFANILFQECFSQTFPIQSVVFWPHF